MKYATFSLPDDPTIRLGFVRGTRVVDTKTFGSVLDLIEAGPDAWKRMAALFHSAPAGAGHPLAEVRFHAPIPRPRKNVFCLALNYGSHVIEAAAARGRAATTPDAPVFFTKAPTTVNGPYDPVPWDPGATRQVDYEAELGVIIGAGGKNIPREKALDHVFGYTVINDVSARDLQRKHGQNFKGKSLDGFCPMGPVVVTADEFGDPQDKCISLRLNGEVRQRATTAEMIFPVDAIIESLSQGMTIEAGDIIATGTPGGVGLCRTPPEYLREGDVMEAAIEGIGMLRNRIVASAEPLVSVIIPCYNGGAFLARAIDSALAQTYRNLELIVVDDGSTDDSPSTIARYGDRLRVITQENRGLPAARNVALDRARGAIVAYLDADDAWYPEKIERQVRCLLANPRCVLVHTDAGIVGPSDEPVPEWRRRRPAHGRCLLALVLSNSIYVSSVAHWRSALRDERFCPALTACEDWDMWLRLAAAGPFAYLDEVLTLYRVHPSNMSKQRRRMYTNGARAIDRVLERDITWLVRAAAYRTRARCLLGLGYIEYVEGNRRAARRLFAKALPFVPGLAFVRLIATCLPARIVDRLRSA